MEIKAYKLGDELKIIELFEQSFGKKMSLEYWKWRFSDNPFTSNIFIDLMWDNDLLVGHYAVSPVEMILEDKKILTALSMTTMTHPQYGGKGIFSKLAENLYKRLTEEGYTMVWGFPNNNSHYGFNKNLNNIITKYTSHQAVDEIKMFSNIFKSYNHTSSEGVDIKNMNYKIKKAIMNKKINAYKNQR